MLSGIVFDIKEFAVHDGPGIRTTIFLKGCPLRCIWCHNPEGQLACPEILHTRTGQRVSGRTYTSLELADRLRSQIPLLRAGAGGLTFSGGEPLLQPAFLLEMLSQLPAVHTVLDTSGSCSPEVFQDVVSHMDLVLFDLKILDSSQHRKWTGKDNEEILENFEYLCRAGIPCIIRIPLIPGITATDQNLSEIAGFLAEHPPVRSVELLRYNRLSGAKYEMLHREMPIHPEAGSDPAAFRRVFSEQGLNVTIR